MEKDVCRAIRLHPDSVNQEYQTENVPKVKLGLTK